MSKIGRTPITIPASVTITVNGNSVVVKGPKGELSSSFDSRIKLDIQDNVLTLTRASDAKPVRALHGLTRALLANMVQGVVDGFTKSLELVGTGYRAKLSGRDLTLSLGFSHEVKYKAPESIELAVEGTNLIHIKGLDKQLVGQVAADIRSLRKPEPYKGKGIRYLGEQVRRKAGKAAKAAAA